MKFLFAILSLSTILFTTKLNAQVVFRGVSPQQVVKSYNFTYTSDVNYNNPWGVDITQPGYVLTGVLKLVQDNSSTKDSLGCNQNGNDLTGKIAFIYRGDCYFDQKIYYAQNRGAIGVVVVNNEAGSPIGMSPGSFASQVTIPAIMISKDDGAFLKQYMDQGDVEVILGNLQNYYGYNVGVEKALTLVPDAGSKPTISMKGNSSWDFELGTFVINRGANNLTQVAVNAIVTKDNDTVYNELSSTININSGDTTWIALPNFTSTDKSVGNYKLSYIAKLLNNVDEDRTNDTITFYFNTSNDLFSLSPLDENNLPVATTYTTSGSTGLTSFTQCITFEDPYSESLALTGLYFSAHDPNDGSIAQDEVNILAYKWLNTYDPNANPIENNFDLLDELNSTYYYFENDDQDSSIFAPFSEPILLEKNAKYLFCVNPTSKIDLLLGYNENVDYSVNDGYFDESNNPLRVFTGGITPKWYEGFTGYLAPSIGAKFISAEELGLKTSFNNDIQLTVYPNPSKNTIYIKSEGTVQIETISIYDVYGKAVFNSTVNIDKIDISQFNSGMYFLKVQDEKGNVSTINFVKE
jgi:hypothetical protein